MNKSESKYFNTAVRMDKALITLLEKKDFSYITVSEICKTAGVNRSTFYLHYETVGDLLEETTRYLLDDFMSCFPMDAEQLSAHYRDCDSRELNFVTAQYLHPYLTYIRDNRRVFSTVLSNGSSFGFEGIFSRLYEHIFDPILDHFHYPPTHRPYVMRFYLNGVNAVVTEWLKSGCDISVEEMSVVIQECIFGRDSRLMMEISEQN